MNNGAITHQFLIASYPRDYHWLRFCLLSLRKFSDGFLPPCVVVAPKHGIGPQSVGGTIRQCYPEATVGIEDGPAHLGNLRAQVSMMKSDIHCPKADYVYLLGSDCLATRRFDPTVFWRAGRPEMLFNSYTHVEKFHRDACCWRGGTTQALGWIPEFEYMRRLPIPYPRDVFARARGHVSNLHGKPFEDYVYSTGKNSWPQFFSESNVLGAFAHKYMEESYTWTNLDAIPWPNNNPVVQFWSHGGLDRPRDGHPVTVTPRRVIRQALGPDVGA